MRILPSRLIKYGKGLTKVVSGMEYNRYTDPHVANYLNKRYRSTIRREKLYNYVVDPTLIVGTRKIQRPQVIVVSHEID